MLKLLKQCVVRTACMAAVGFSMVTGCGPDLGAPDEMEVAADLSDEAFQAWRAVHVKVMADGQYLVENDMRMPDLATVRQHWADTTQNPRALSVFRPNGADAVWSRADRWNVNYCIRSSDFGSDYNRLVEFMHRAASGWEAVANVHYVHLKAEDGSGCTRSNTKVKYNVERNFSFEGLSAGMGFPTYSRSNRYLELGPTSEWTDEELLAVLIHEFGHSLGFVHEQDTASGCNMLTTSSYRQLTCYDGRGAMHYPFVAGWLDPSRDLNFISQWDLEGAQSVYEAPTNVMATANGTVYARKRTTGDFYRRDASGWTKIGNPGQAFVAVGNTLYGQIPEHGSPVKYTGSGWVTIGGPAGQIFACMNTLCATDPTSGNIARYDAYAKSWAFIGGPGSRFASTTTDLFGIGPWQDDYIAHWNGSGSSWSIVGGGGSELIGGGSKMYRLTNTKSAIQRYDGGSTWTTIGLSGRSFVAVGNDVYGLRPDGSWIMKYNTTQWNSIHGAAMKIYGSNGYLFATKADDTIERYEPTTNTWTNLGKP